MRKLSIIIPAFNEAGRIAQLLERVARVGLVFGITKQIVIVNDASTDDTGKLIDHFVRQYPELDIYCLTHSRNRGKGDSVAGAIRHITGDVVIVQDADLEYDPQDYNVMLRTMEEKQADVVYGSRFLAGRRVTSLVHRFGNGVLTWFLNMQTGLHLTDSQTCYKLLRASLFREIVLNEPRFGFDTEITAKLARIPRLKFVEVPISYAPRGFSEGKKIGPRDGFRAIWCTLKYARKGARGKYSPDRKLQSVDSQ